MGWNWATEQATQSDKTISCGRRGILIRLAKGSAGPASKVSLHSLSVLPPQAGAVHAAAAMAVALEYHKIILTQLIEQDGLLVLGMPASLWDSFSCLRTASQMNCTNPCR